jgi:hypothetical protein
MIEPSKDNTFDNNCKSIELGLNTLIDFAEAKGLELSGTIIAIEPDSGISQIYNL